MKSIFMLEIGDKIKRGDLFYDLVSYELKPIPKSQHGKKLKNSFYGVVLKPIKNIKESI